MLAFGVASLRAPAGWLWCGFVRIMAPMLPTQAPQVKPSAPQTVREMLKEQALIWGLFGGAALLLAVTGWDAALVHAVHLIGGNTFTKLMRSYGSYPAILMALGGLVCLFWPKLWQKRPTLYQTAAVFTLSLILGAGLFNQILVKNLADRPRPRDAILAETPQNLAADSFRGNSMPSGHAAVGFVLAAPFFPLRRQRPKLAKAFLATGLGAGGLLGLSRMMLGAHFPTDILIAGAIGLSSAALLTYLLQKYRRIPAYVLALGTLATALAVILGNFFYNLTLTYPLTEPFREIRLPCQPVTVMAEGPATLTVVLHGYGAPLSNLELVKHNDIISLQTHLGLYHSLKCTATLSQPAE